MKSGTYWVNLQNATTQFGDPLFWDENSGPSYASESAVGTIASEAFDVTGGGHSACGGQSGAPTPSEPTWTFNVIHTFTGGEDGSHPNAATADGAGNIYGTTIGCPGCNAAAAFKLTNSGSGWLLNPLYHFSTGWAAARTLGPEGALYGWAKEQACNGSDCIFNLKPPPTAPRSVFDLWRATEIYPLENSGNTVDFVFDQAGNIYGSSRDGGGDHDSGMVYKLMPSSAGWTMTVLYSFGGGSDGAAPSSVVIDKSGNLYGTTYSGGAYGYGTVFQLSSTQSGWTKKSLHDFAYVDGGAPTGLTLDTSGNLYGATAYGSPITVFKLMPSDGGWTFSIIRGMTDLEGHGPVGRLAVDAAGNVYGATTASICSNSPAASAGTCPLPQNYINSQVFKLTPSGGCTVLHDFGGSNAENLSLDAHGNLYGTQNGGQYFGNGDIWEITQ